MKGLKFDEEPYVKVYTTDTPNWLRLSMAARGLYLLLLRAADADGRLILGDIASTEVSLAVATFLRGEEQHVQEPLCELATSKFVEFWHDKRGTVLSIPCFAESQYARTSSRMRNQNYAARRRARGGT